MKSVASTHKTRLGLAATIVGGVALVLAFLPGASLVAWAPALVAMGLGIAAVVVKNRKKLLGFVGLGLGIAALIVAIIVSVVTAAALLASVNDAVASDAPSAATTDEEALAEPAAEAPVEEEPLAPTGSGEAFNDPAPFGTVVEISSFSGATYTVSVGAPTWDANALVAAENQFNDAPAEGMIYVTAPVTYTNTGAAEPITPRYEAFGIALMVNGVAYEQASVVIPNELTSDDIFPGGTVTGNVVYEIPAGTNSAMWVFESEFFVTA